MKTYTYSDAHKSAEWREEHNRAYHELFNYITIEALNWEGKLSAGRNFFKSTSLIKLPGLDALMEHGLVTLTDSAEGGTK